MASHNSPSDRRLSRLSSADAEPLTLTASPTHSPQITIPSSPTSSVHPQTSVPSPAASSLLSAATATTPFPPFDTLPTAPPNPPLKPLTATLPPPLTLPTYDTRQPPQTIRSPLPLLPPSPTPGSTSPNHNCPAPSANLLQPTAPGLRVPRNPITITHSPDTSLVSPVSLLRTLSPSPRSPLSPLSPAALETALLARVGRCRVEELGRGRHNAGKASKVLGEELPGPQCAERRVVSDESHPELGEDVDQVLEDGLVAVERDTGRGEEEEAEEEEEEEAEEADAAFDLRLRKLSLVEALRSNPPDSEVYVRRAATVPSWRRGGFWAKEDINPGSRGGVGAGFGGGRSGGGAGVGNDGSGAGLRHGVAARLFGNRTEGGLALETSSVAGVDTKELKPQDGTIVVRVGLRTGTRWRVGSVAVRRGEQLDDEAFFQRLRGEYFRLKGGWVPALLGARTVVQVRVCPGGRFRRLGDEAEVVDRGLVERGPERGVGGAAGLRLFARPRGGKGTTEWVAWASGSAGGEAGAEVALEIEEGWNAGRIVCAVAGVLLASTVITVLWVLVGVEALRDTAASHAPDRMHGWGGAAGRVQVGGILGVLVLLLGWTVVGGWLMVNWLVD